MTIQERIREIFAEIYDGKPEVTAYEAIEYMLEELTTADIAEHMEGVAKEWFEIDPKNHIRKVAVESFLAYAKNPPKPKRKFPFKKGEYERCMMRDKDHGWMPICLVDIVRQTFPFMACNEAYNIIAPFDKDYIGTTKEHPDQITAESLGDYDLSEWEKGE